MHIQEQIYEKPGLFLYEIPEKRDGYQNTSRTGHVSADCVSCSPEEALFRIAEAFKGRIINPDECPAPGFMLKWE